MDQTKINAYLGVNAQNFAASDIQSIRERLAAADDDMYHMLQGVTYRSPALIFCLAFFLGWERFFIDDIGMGVAKILTIYVCLGLGCVFPLFFLASFLWWLIDVCSAQRRAREYNSKKILQILA